jgi:hypothetical protein
VDVSIVRWGITKEALDPLNVNIVNQGDLRSRPNHLIVAYVLLDNILHSMGQLIVSYVAKEHSLPAGEVSNVPHVSMGHTMMHRE